MRTGTENKIEIVLIRHSYTKMNEEHRYLGKKDESLSELGKELAMSKQIYTDLGVFSGPMKRCVETANLIFNNKDIIEIPEWTEIDFGDFEGKNYNELKGNPDYKRWIDSGGTIAFPNGERREDFISRSKCGFDNVIEYMRTRTGFCEDGSCSVHKVYSVLHGGNIMAIMYSLLGGDYFDYQVKPLEGYKIVVDLSWGNKIVEYEEWK